MSALFASMAANLAACVAVFRARCRALLQYRAAAAAGFGTQLFWGLIKVMVLEAFYGNAARHTSAAPLPMALEQAVTYTWLGQAFFQLLPFSTNPDPEVRELIRTGAVGYELARPLDLHALWLARTLAARVAPTLLRAVPMFAVAVPLLGMSPPPSLAAGGAWAAAMVGAAALVGAFATAVTSTMLWTTSGDGIARIVPSLVLVASGMIVPLPLFPPWIQPWLGALPFRGMVDAPFRLYLGHLPAGALPGVLLHQALWTAAFVALGRAMVARGLRRLVVQGG
ncbi:ABC transporter permease [Sorangium sp. So ce1000]|uniref:ABC transporter permease n=1 Tax=Sorangium sp. So ce1000 TaxID=3133325 RepID=UPI003F648511